MLKLFPHPLISSKGFFSNAFSRSRCTRCILGCLPEYSIYIIVSGIILIQLFSRSRCSRRSSRVYIHVSGFILIQLFSRSRCTRRSSRVYIPACVWYCGKGAKTNPANEGIKEEIIFFCKQFNP